MLHSTLTQTGLHLRRRTLAQFDWKLPPQNPIFKPKSRQIHFFKLLKFWTDQYWPVVSVQRCPLLSINSSRQLQIKKSADYFFFPKTKEPNERIALWCSIWLLQRVDSRLIALLAHLFGIQILESSLRKLLCFQKTKSEKFKWPPRTYRP